MPWSILKFELNLAKGNFTKDFSSASHYDETKSVVYSSNYKGGMLRS